MIKFSIGTAIIMGLAIWALNTQWISQIEVIQAMKKDTQASFNHFTESTKNQIIDNALELLHFDYQKDYLNHKATIVPQVQEKIAQNSNLTTTNTPTTVIKNDMIVPTNSSHMENSSEPNINIVANQNSEFKHLSIPFFYDGSQAPKNLSKDTILSMIQTQSNKWNEACNISFDYKGDRETDYIDNNQITARDEGIIKWGQLEGEAIGQAHQGTWQGPATGFVMVLEPQYFAKADNVNFLGPTILHEMGHVIGLSHSHNPHSIMFWQQSERPQVLDDTDKNMCRYFRSRWEGLSTKEASDKYGLVVNEAISEEVEDK